MRYTRRSLGKFDSATEFRGGIAVLTDGYEESLGKLDSDKLVGSIISQSKPRRKSGGRNADPSKEAEHKIALMLQLRTFVKCLPAVCIALKGSRSTLLVTIEKLLSDETAGVMAALIDGTINEDAMSSLQKGALAAKNTKVKLPTTARNPPEKYLC
jgi:DNA mismatch repair protein MSH4